MGGRYLITGSQIGVLKAFFNLDDINQADKLLNEIVEKQYLGNSTKPIGEDVKLNIIDEAYKD